MKEKRRGRRRRTTKRNWNRNKPQQK